jgi:hypothetical protein
MTSPTEDEVICILDASSVTTYNPNTSNVFVTPLAGQKPFPEYRVTPKHYWSGYQIH